MSDAKAVLGIDPGARPGFGVLSADRRVLHCDVKPPPVGAFGPMIAVIERPVLRPVRKGDRRKIDPRGIVTLAFTAGRIAGRIESRPDVAEMFEVEPSQWKGRVEKAVMLKRIRAFFGLGDGGSDDAVDALGIAGWLSGINWLRGFAP